MATKIVTFKTEYYDDDAMQPVGPVTVVDVEARDADSNYNPDIGGIPYGYEPPWLLDLGWRPRAEALEIAEGHEVELHEV